MPSSARLYFSLLFLYYEPAWRPSFVKPKFQLGRPVGTLWDTCEYMLHCNHQWHAFLPPLLSATQK